MQHFVAFQHGLWLSPRIRFDLTVNELPAMPLFTANRKSGAPVLKPYCHVEDPARAVVLVLESPEEKVRANVFNVESTEENYNKGMIIEEVCKVVPNVKVHYVEKHEDPRDYRVNFDKIKTNWDIRSLKSSQRCEGDLRSYKNRYCYRSFGQKFRNI